MKVSIQKFYRKWEAFQHYGISNKKRVDEIGHFYSSNRKYFGKRVLDIACGGGVLGFLVDQTGISYTGIDINPDMIKTAELYSKKTGSRCNFILGNAINKKISGEFDTIVCIGNSLSHLTSKEFQGIPRNLNSNAEKGTCFIVDYRDTIGLLFKKAWKDKFEDTNNGITKTIVTKGCNTVNGEIYQDGFVKGKLLMKSKQTIWSPFILEPIMRSYNWSLIKRTDAKEWQGWLDIYQKV